MQVSLGTLLAYTTVAISVLILRYVPPDEVPLPSSLQEAIDSVLLRYKTDHIPGDDVYVENTRLNTLTPESSPLLVRKEAHPPIYGACNCKFLSDYTVFIDGHFVNVFQFISKRVKTM